MDLRILVGTNLASLSKLEGVDLAMYQSSVLPQILEQVHSSAREFLSPSFFVWRPNLMRMRPRRSSTARTPSHNSTSWSA